MIDPLRQVCLEHGVFLRREALAHGVDDAALRRACRMGALVRVRHGAYTFADMWPGQDDAARHTVLASAVMRAHPGSVALSHHSGVLLHQVESWGLPTDKVHVTRLDGGAGRVCDDVVHHEGLLLPEDLVERQGLTVVRAERAVLEAASLLDVERGLVLADSGLRQGLYDRGQLADQARLMDSWPQSLKLQLVARLADGRSGSVGESRSRYVFWCCNVPAPQLQYEVHDDAGLAGIADFAWPEHRLLGEFDGRVKYEALLRPGEKPSDVVFREKLREDRMRRATGWGFVRITWDMLSRPTATAALVRSMMQAAR